MKIFRIFKELLSGSIFLNCRQTPGKGPDDLLALELQRRKHKRLFRGLTWMVIFIFAFQQTGFSGDMIKFSYERSPVADLLSGEREIERMNGMSAPYLIRTHRKHEHIIRSKNLVEEDMRLLLDNRRDKRGTIEDAPLKKKQGISSGSDKRIEYTLSDYDDRDEPQQISVYSYDKGDEALKSVISYDIRRRENEWDRDDLEDVSEEDLPRVMASYRKGDYSRLTDTLKVTETVYFGDRSEEKVDYVLSDFREGKATSVSLYVYEDDRILKEVDTYDITDLAGPFSLIEWKRHIIENDRLWRSDVETNGRLTRRTVYEGAEGEESIVYSLSEYDENVVPGKVECYDYSGGTISGALTYIRAYNIKGIELETCLDDLREDRREYDHMLKTKTTYMGEKDRERIDYVYGSYYKDDKDGVYKPASRTEYVYRGGTGRMERTETYCVRNGARILRRCSEFTGLRGYEDLERQYEYERDGTTLNSVSIFEYDLPVDIQTSHIGGDDDIYTLDRVTEYRGTDDPHDLTTASVKTETYYDGGEDREYVAIAFGFDMASGKIVTRTEYERCEGVLKEVLTYRLTDPSAGYGLGTGKLVSLSVFEGEKDLEKICYAESYDLAGTLLSRTDHSYASDGRLTDTATMDNRGNVVSVTRYEGAEDLEKRYLSTAYDLSGREISRSEYGYTLIDSLQTVFTFDLNGNKVSRSMYDGVPGEENIVSSTRYDRHGEVTGTTEYLYDGGGALSRTVTRNDRGIRISGTVYDGPEGFERIISAESFDLRDDSDPLKKILTSTAYIYAECGSLVRTVTADSGGNRLSMSLFEGVMGNERVRSKLEYDQMGEELVRTLYEYDESGALDGTVARSVPLGGKVLSRSDLDGVKGFETVDTVVSYDREGNELSRVSYMYDGSGAISLTVMTGSDGTELTRTVYKGKKDNEKVDRVERFDLSGNILSIARYIYGVSGALVKVTNSDAGGNRTSETDHEGDMGRERVVLSRTYDGSDELLTSTTHTYAASGALTSTVTRGYTDSARSEMVLLSSTGYTGASGLELSDRKKEYDRSGELLRVVEYGYAADGSLDNAVTRTAADMLVSTTEYSGRMGRERIELVADHDNAGAVLVRTEYEYGADGAIERTLAYDGSDDLLSVTAYTGRMGREKIEQVTGYDDAGDELTLTEYEYGADGAIVRTLARDEADRLLSGTLYTGLSGSERVESVTRYDGEGEELTRTEYEYGADGAIECTLTRDDANSLLSRAVYAGRMGREQVEEETEYDRAGEELVRAVYEYNEDGSIKGTLRVDTEGNRLSYTGYTGRKGRERVMSVNEYDKSGLLLVLTLYEYGADGAIERTLAYDKADNLLSGTVYAGRKGRERIERVTEYDGAGEELTRTEYGYGADGAIERTRVYDEADNLLSGTIYAGRKGRERIEEVTAYDDAGELLTRTEYGYGADGAIERTLAYDEADNLLSGTVYAGRKGRERVDDVTEYDDAGELLTRTEYGYGADGAIERTRVYDEADNLLSGTIYAGRKGRERIEEVTEYDGAGEELTRTEYGYGADGAIECTLAYDEADNLLSGTVYAGRKGRERVDDVTEYDDAGELLTRTEYEYTADGAIERTLAYDGSGDLLSGTVYAGRKGRERIERVAGYDDAGDELTRTIYEYNADGSIKGTLREDTGESRLSYTEYTGRKGRERVLAGREYDESGLLLTRTIYEYNSDGALAFTRSEDEEGALLSGTVYAGRKGRERIDEVTEYDGAGEELTRTEYEYGVDGAIERTLVYDEADSLLSGTAYTGRKGREKIESVTGYDEAGEVLTRTEYEYGVDGAIERTRVYDEGDNLLSATAYTGRKGRERIESVTGYDEAGDELTRTIYEYNADGSIKGTLRESAGGSRLSYTEYTGRKGRERVLAGREYDESGLLLTRTIYEYNSDGALAFTRSEDEEGALLSGTIYDGRKGREQVEQVIEYDGAGEVLTRTEYGYGADGAIERTLVYDEADSLLSVTAYTGRKGREKIEEVTGYDDAGEVLTRTEYEYGTDGAIELTLGYDEADNLLSGTLYSGRKGREKIERVTGYDEAGDELTRTIYEYNADGSIKGTLRESEGGSRLSYTVYRGRKGREVLDTVRNYDDAEVLLSRARYTYKADGAIDIVVTKDQDGNKLSESVYAGRKGRERVHSSVSYDGLGQCLTRVEYEYGADGSLGSTVTYDPEGSKLTEMMYSGRKGREREVRSMSYDLAGTLLSVTRYTYREDGAMDSTGTTDAEGNTISVTSYSGRMNSERVAQVRSYDLEGTRLTTTDYEYGTSGAILKSVTYSYHEQPRRLSETLYEGRKGRERTVSALSYDLAGNMLRHTEYVYDEAGALTGTLTSDEEGNITTETLYTGRKDRERTSRSVSYRDDGGTAENVTDYVYSADTGALDRAVTSEAVNGPDGTVTAGGKLSLAMFAGLSGRERNDLTVNYEPDGETPDNRVEYFYSASGALSRTATREDGSDVVTSETRYYGLDGYEVADRALNYSDDGNEVRTSTYYYYESFAGYDGETPVYVTGRASGAFREDPLRRAETYLGGSADSVPGDLVIDSIAYYEGPRDKEVLRVSQSWDYVPGSDVERYLASTTMYEYNDDRALRVSRTYQEGNEDSPKDVDGLRRSYLSRYEGDRGNETVRYMEGTTCSYDRDNYLEWEYWVRTGFTYDGENRNTGYFEETFVPSSEWDWEGDTSGDMFADAVDVRFTEFDHKDRYLRLVKTVCERDAAGGYEGSLGAYSPTGETYIQEDLDYEDDNVRYYREIHTEADGEENRHEIFFDDMIGDRARTITTRELDSANRRTGDHSIKSAIEYYGDGHMFSGQVAGYELESLSDGRSRQSTVYDIRYNRALTVEDKVSSPDDIIYFSDRGGLLEEGDIGYTLRQYKYNSRRELETTLNVNGDSVSVTDSEGRVIFFEWTANMLPYREKDFVSEKEPQGAGPREGSARTSNPVLDILEEARKCVPSGGATPRGFDEYISDAPEWISYENGQVSRIEGIKGNIYDYEGNRLVRLTDTEGNVAAEMEYTDTEDSLTVRMNWDGESALPETGKRGAVYGYDGALRKTSAEVIDGDAVTLKNERFSYEVSEETGEVLRATVHREFLEAGSLIVVDRLEEYADTRLDRVYTHSKVDAGRSFVSLWEALEYDEADDKLLRCRDVRFDSTSFDLEQYTSDTGLTAEDTIFDYIDDLTASGNLGLSQEDVAVFGRNSVMITDETWKAVYTGESNIDHCSTVSNKFKYAPISNMIALPDTVHSYKGGGQEGSNSVDGDLDTYQGGSKGRSDDISVESCHLFDTPVDISGIFFKIKADAKAWGYDEYGASWRNRYDIYIIKDGSEQKIDSGSPGGMIENTIEVNEEQVEGIRVTVSAGNSICGGKGDGFAVAELFEIQAMSPDTDHYNFLQVAGTTTDYYAGEYDRFGNVLGYEQISVYDNSPATVNGTGRDETRLVTETVWEAEDGYIVDQVRGYTRNVDRYEPEGDLDVTETVNREEIVYENGEVISYREAIDTTEDMVITEKLVSDVEYQNGMKIAFKETTRLFKEAEGTPYNVTCTHRQNTGYDGRGNMVRWHDLYTPDISLYEDSGNYDISDELSGIRETDERCSGLSDKELVRWAMTEGWKDYPARLDYYGPREKQVVISDLDELGRMLEFREVETGFMDVAADQPLEERRITTSRTDIRYSAVDSDKIRSQRLITKTEKIENGQWVVEEEDNAYKFDIKYNRDGKEYSYSSFSDGEVSRVDSSEYNILGQLARQYTKIDAYSYSETFYYYDSAGNMTRTKNHYHYHKQWSEDAGKDTAHYTQHYEKTTVYDRYGEKLSEDVNEYTHVDIEKSFWTDTFGQYIIKAVGMVLNCVPTLGPFLSLAFNTVVQVVQGTFNWMSFAISVATNLVKVGMRAIGDAISGVSSDIVKVDGVEIGSSNLFSSEFNMEAFQIAFSRNLANAIVSTAITEGIYEVGERNNWDTFLTTSVATFASTAVSYGMNNNLDLTSLAFASGEALAAGAIDKFVEENPSEWAMFLAPIAKTAISEISGLGLLMKRRFDSKSLKAELGEVAHAAAFAATASTSGQRDGLRNAVPESRVKELINEGMSWLRDKGWASYSEGELTAQGLKDGMIRAIYDKSQAVLSDVGDPGTYMPDITAPTDILSAESYFDGVRNTELSPEISTLDFGTVEVAGIKGEAAEIAEMAGAKVASLIVDLKTGVKFYRFDVLKDVEPVLQMIAAEPSIETYAANMDLSDNGSVELMVSADGKEKYLVGDAGFGELKGAAGDWAALAGYGPGDKVEFELNLNSGDLFMFLDVSDPRGFFSRENRNASVQVERLARDITTRIGDIAALKSMEISVRINEAGAKDGEIVKAAFTIDQKDITNMALARRVQGYLKSNFDGLRGGGFDVVLSMEPSKGNRVEIDGLALDLDRGSVRDTIDSLKEQTPKLRRLANEIEELVKLAGGDADAFERITLKVDKRGEYVVRVKIRSEALMGLDLLMNRMSIREGSAEYSRLLKREFSYFNVDVKTGTYALDLSLRCAEFENMLMRAGEARVTARDTSGRVLSEEIRNSLGDIVVRKDYKYADTHPEYFKGDNASYGDVCRVETFTVTMPGGEEGALNRMSYGTFTGDIFTAAVSAFQPLDAFEGGTFGYVVGDLVVEMKIAMREAEGEEARAVAVTGTLPAGQMGLSVDLGMAVQGGGEERRLVYSPYEIDITLAGESMMIDGADILTVNGVDRNGAVFYTWDSEGKGGMMFLRNGAGIEVEGGGINVISGEALFFDEGMVRTPEGGIPVEGSGIPAGMDIPEDAVVTPAGDPVGDLLVPLAWAGGIAGSVEFKGSEYNIGPNGDIIPVSGEFRIEGNRVLVGDITPVAGESELDNRIPASSLDKARQMVAEFDKWHNSASEYDDFEKAVFKGGDRILAVVDKAREAGGDSLYSRMTISAVSRMAPMGMALDPTTVEGYLTSYLVVGGGEMMIAAGSKTAMGGATALGIVLAGLLNPTENLKAAKLLGITKEAWKKINNDLKRIVNAAMSIGKAGDIKTAAGVMRELGRQAGKIIVAIYAGKALSPVLRRLKGAVNGILGRGIRGFKKIGDSAGSGLFKGIKASFGKNTARSFGRSVKAVSGKGRQFSGAIGAVVGRMGNFIRNAQRRAIERIRPGGGKLGAGLSAERSGLSARAEGLSAERSGLSAVAKGLRLFQKAFEKVAEKIWKTYISKRTGKYLSQITKGILATYTGTGVADKVGAGLAVGNGVRQLGMAGLAGSVIPSLITPDNVNMTRDVVYPDLTDPTSTSANFWTGVYEDVSAVWEALFFDEGMVRAPEGGMPVEGSGIPGGMDIPEDAAVTPAGDPVGDLLVPLAWAGGIAGSVEFKGSEYNIGPSGDIIPVSGEFRIEGNRVLVGGVASVEAPVPADVGGTGVEHKGMFEQLFYEDIHNILWEAVKSNIENGPDKAFDDLKTYVVSTASERFGISRDLAGRYASTVLFVAGGIMSAIGVPSMRTKHEKLGAAMFALRFAEGVPKRFLQTVMDNIGLTMDLGARALTSNKGFFGSKMFGAGMVLDEVIGMFKGGWEGFDAKIYKNVDYLVAAFKDSWTAVEGAVKLWASGGYLEKISAVGKFCGEITGLYLYTRCLRGIIKKIPGGQRFLDRVNDIESSVTRKIGGKFNEMAGPFLEKFKDTKFGRKVAAVGRSLRKGTDDAPGGRRGANSKNGPRSAVDVQKHNRKAQKLGTETGDPAGPGSIGTKKSGAKGIFKKRGSKSAAREGASAAREGASAAREGAGEQFNIFTGLLETAVDEFKGTVTGRTQVEDGFRNKLRSEARERAAMAFGGSGEVDILLREMGRSGKAGRGWLVSGRGIEIAAAAFLPGLMMPSLITPDNVNITRDVVYPDLTDPTSISANFWTGVYEDVSCWGEISREFLGISRCGTIVSAIDPVTATQYIDIDLNYGNFKDSKTLGFLDTVTLGQFGNIRWDRATEDGGEKYERILKTHGDKIIGISVSGINSHGEDLDKLARQLAPIANRSFTVTHSAGDNVPLNAAVSTDKILSISPQAGRIKKEEWIDELGMEKENILVVDISGDLPFRPTGLFRVEARDMLDPGAFIQPLKIFIENAYNAGKNNVYSDYSQNPNDKYIYARVVGGFNKDEGWPWRRHNIGVIGALDEARKFTVEVDGDIRKDITLWEIYEEFLRGELK